MFLFHPGLFFFYRSSCHWLISTSRTTAFTSSLLLLKSWVVEGIHPIRRRKWLQGMCSKGYLKDWFVFWNMWLELLPFTFPLVVPTSDSVCPLPLPSPFISLLLSDVPYFLDLSFAFCVTTKYLSCPVSPYRPTSFSLLFLFSPPTSVSSVSWLLWWGTEYLFLVRNLHGGVMPRHHPCPFLSVFLSNLSLFLYLPICTIYTIQHWFTDSHIVCCPTLSFPLYWISSSNASLSLAHLLLGFDVFCNLGLDAYNSV